MGITDKGERAERPETVSAKVIGAISEYFGSVNVAAVAVAALTAEFLLEPKFTTLLAAVVLKLRPVRVRPIVGLKALGVKEVI